MLLKLVYVILYPIVNLQFGHLSSSTTCDRKDGKNEQSQENHEFRSKNIAEFGIYNEKTCHILAANITRADGRTGVCQKIRSHNPISVLKPLKGIGD
jgi:hypothetical protein